MELSMYYIIELDMVIHTHNFSQEDLLSPGVQEQPREHNKTWSQKVTKNKGAWRKIRRKTKEKGRGEEEEKYIFEKKSKYGIPDLTQYTK